MPFYSLPDAPSAISVTDGISISTFTTQSCIDCFTIPTLGTWGLIILFLLIIVFSVVKLWKRDSLCVGANEGGDIVGVPTYRSGLTITLSATDGNLLDMNGVPIPVGTPIPEVGTTGIYKLPFYSLPDAPSTVSVTDGISVSAFTTQSCIDCFTIPTLGTWGLIILFLLIIVFSVVKLWQRNEQTSIIQ